MLASQFESAVKNHACPKCNVSSGEDCKRPSGIKAWPPHPERLRLLTEAEIAASRLIVTKFGA